MTIIANNETGFPQFDGWAKGIYRGDLFISAGRHMAFNNALNRMIKKAKVKRKRITPHGLWHTHATILLNQKTSVITVAKRFGNTPEEVYKTYGLFR